MGTRDAKLVPDTTRVMGIVVHRDCERATVFLPYATGRKALANLEDNGRVAVTCSHPVSHLTFQLKGNVLSLRPAKANERDVVERYLDAFSRLLEQVGVAPEVSSRMSGWPAHAVEMQVREIYEQTPGPGAGERLDNARGRG